MKAVLGFGPKFARAYQPTSRPTMSPKKPPTKSMAVTSFICAHHSMPGLVAGQEALLCYGVA